MIRRSYALRENRNDRTAYYARTFYLRGILVCACLMLYNATSETRHYERGKRQSLSFVWTESANNVPSIDQEQSGPDCNSHDMQDDDDDEVDYDDDDDKEGCEEQFGSSRNNNIQDTNDDDYENDGETTVKDDDDDDGWVPDVYPSPIIEPNRCSISDIPNAITSAGLRLCDPDRVLGEYYLEQIALALYNFSSYFAATSIETEEKTNLTQVSTTGAPALTNMTTSAPRLYGASMIPLALRLSSLTTNDKIAQAQSAINLENDSVELGVATVRKMNLIQVLRNEPSDIFDENDNMLLNDAAQVFARSLHAAWWGSNTSSSSSNKENIKDDELSAKNSSNGDHGILIFLSVEDRVCVISTGSAIKATLPWWRLESIVDIMQPEDGDYGNAILEGIDYLAQMMEAGPPTVSDRMCDFFSRFGVVLVFALCILLVGADRKLCNVHQRWKQQERRTNAMQRLSSVEKENARLLQREYKTKSCPICLESFDAQDDDDYDSVLSSVSLSDIQSKASKSSHERPLDGRKTTNPQQQLASRGKEAILLFRDKEVGNRADPAKTTINLNTTNGLKRVDEYGIPLHGSDGQAIKILRCGHIFCESCWKSWVSSGCGNPFHCPVCRDDFQNVRNIGSPISSTVAMTRIWRMTRLSAPTWFRWRSSNPASTPPNNRSSRVSEVEAVEEATADEGVRVEYRYMVGRASERLVEDGCENGREGNGGASRVICEREPLISREMGGPLFHHSYESVSHSQQT